LSARARCSLRQCHPKLIAHIRSVLTVNHLVIAQLRLEVFAALFKIESVSFELGSLVDLFLSHGLQVACCLLSHLAIVEGGDGVIITWRVAVLHVDQSGLSIDRFMSSFEVGCVSRLKDLQVLSAPVCLLSLDGVANSCHSCGFLL